MWYPVVTELAMLCLTILMAWQQILAVRIAFRTLLGNRSQGLLAPGMNTNLHRWHSIICGQGDGPHSYQHLVEGPPGLQELYATDHRLVLATQLLSPLANAGEQSRISPCRRCWKLKSHFAQINQMVIGICVVPWCGGVRYCEEEARNRTLGTLLRRLKTVSQQMIIMLTKP